MARKTIQHHFLPAVPARRNPFSPVSRTPSPAFTMADLRVHDDRSGRSRWPIFAFTMTDLAVHDGPIFAFTMVRNSQRIGAKAEKDSLLDALGDPENAADFGRFEVEFKDRVDRLRNHATDRAPAEGPLPLDSF